jgi:hypothetical protein
LRPPSIAPLSSESVGTRAALHLDRQAILAQHLQAEVHIDTHFIGTGAARFPSRKSTADVAATATAPDTDSTVSRSPLKRKRNSSYLNPLSDSVARPAGPAQWGAAVLHRAAHSDESQDEEATVNEVEQEEEELNE